MYGRNEEEAEESVYKQPHHSIGADLLHAVEHNTVCLRLRYSPLVYVHSWY